MAWSQGSRAQFLQTQWSIVLTAGDPTQPAARHALEELCESYRPPLYGFLRRRGLTQHDAEDAVQSFFLHLLAKPFLENVAPANGRFRTFLLTCLERYLFNDWNRQQAEKRGGGSVTVSLDALGEELSGPFLEKAAVLEFDRMWCKINYERKSRWNWLTLVFGCLCGFRSNPGSGASLARPNARQRRVCEDFVPACIGQIASIAQKSH